MSLECLIEQRRWPLKGEWRIARSSKTHVETVWVTLIDRSDPANPRYGRGECRPYERYGETTAGVMAQLEGLRPQLVAGYRPSELAAGSINELSGALPPGAARNAVDCALWDLAAKSQQRPVWQLAGLPEPDAVSCTYTLSLDHPQAMAEAAKAQAWRPLLKLKLGGDEADLERVAAVHQQAPAAELVVDANESWSVAHYQALAPLLPALGVVLLEQPLPAAHDAPLAQLPHPVAVCADESCHTTADLPKLLQRYDAVNIKLDKSGGLTEALALKAAAQEQGFKLMVGCMMASSLGLAPALLVAQGAAVVDLDAPLWLGEDVEPPLTFQESWLQPPPAALWG